MIPRIPPRVAHIIITTNTRNGERSRDLLITKGTKKLFSTCCIIIYSIVIINAAFHDIPRPIIRAGMSAIIGPIYGMNSITPPISARVKVLSVSNQKINSTSVRLTYVMKNILNERISMALIQALRVICISL